MRVWPAIVQCKIRQHTATAYGVVSDFTSSDIEVNVLESVSLQR